MAVKRNLTEAEAAELASCGSGLSIFLVDESEKTSLKLQNHGYRSWNIQVRGESGKWQTLGTLRGRQAVARFVWLWSRAGGVSDGQGGGEAGDDVGSEE